MSASYMGKRQRQRFGIYLNLRSLILIVNHMGSKLSSLRLRYLPEFFLLYIYFNIIYSIK